MIGRIHGELMVKQPTQLLVDVNGVGYEIEVPLSTYYEVGEPGDQVTIHIQMIVREDAQLLYGFHSLSERELFRSLIKVNKVGPKLAITILSGIDVTEFSRCIRTNDVEALTALPGVGKKTAEQLIIGMRDRLPDTTGSSSITSRVINVNLADAEAALIGLGYKSQDASKALLQAQDPEATVEKLIRQALILLSSK